MPERDVVAEVEKALAEVSPEPWTMSHRMIGAKDTDDERLGLGWDFDDGCGWPEPGRGVCARAADARFLMNCQSWLRALLQRCEQAEQERDTFYVDYRVKTDEQLKQAHVELYRLRYDLGLIMSDVVNSQPHETFDPVAIPQIVNQIIQERDRFKVENELVKARLTDALDAPEMLRGSIAVLTAKNERLTAQLEKVEGSNGVRYMRAQYDSIVDIMDRYKAENERLTRAAETTDSWNGLLAGRVKTLESANEGLVTRLACHEQDIDVAYQSGWQQALVAISHGESTTVHEALARFKASRKGSSE